MTQQIPQQPAQAPVFPQAPIPPHMQAAPEAKRNWFSRHKVLTGLGGAVVLVVVISLASGGGGNGGADADAGAGAGAAKAPVAEGPTAEAAGQNPAAETEEASKKEAPKEEAPKPSSKPGIGTPVTSGDFEFTVLSVEEAGAEVGGQYLQTTAQGRFVRVNVKVTNVGDKPKYFLTSALTIIDEKGRSFNADTTGTLYDQANSDTWVSEVNPGNSIEGGVIFDLPADVVATTLKVSGGVFSGDGEINIAG